MDEYLKLLELLCKRNLDYQVLNSGPEHAAQLIGAIVRNSTEQVRAYASDMNGDISNSKAADLPGDFRKAIEKGLKVQVLLDKTPAADSPLLKVLKQGVQNSPGKVSVRLAPQEFKVAMTENDEVIHFTVGDTMRFRKEYDPVNHLAIGNMNDPFEAKALIGLFDEHFVNATPLFVS